MGFTFLLIVGSVCSDDNLITFNAKQLMCDPKLGCCLITQFKTLPLQGIPTAAFVIHMK